MRVYKVHNSASSGPGTRTVVHFQGCDLGCNGCFNKHLWPETGESRFYTPGELVDEMMSSGLKHFSVSGGEPFQQNRIGAFLTMLMAHTRPIGGSIVVFTGYSIPELNKKGYGLSRLSSLCDYLVAGRYNAAKAHQSGLTSSSNQQAYDFSGRVVPGTKRRKFSLSIAPTGDMTLTGFPTEKDERAIL